MPSSVAIFGQKATLKGDAAPNAGDEQRDEKPEQVNLGAGMTDGCKILYRIKWYGFPGTTGRTITVCYSLNAPFWANCASIFFSS